MKKRRTFTVMIILIAVLILGVGYAAISNVTLYLTGTANVVADADFSVEYDTTHTVGLTADSGNVTLGSNSYAPVAGAYTDATHATMTVYLDKNHTSVSACYKIDNKSTALAATITPTITQVASPNNAYFGTITTGLYSDSNCSTSFSGNVAHGSSVYLKVTVPKGSTEPATDVTGASFSVTLAAAPAE